MNLYFPQLSTGCIGQYPITRRSGRRTVVNVLADESEIRMPDAGAAAVRWQLSYTNLTRDEISALQSLFESTSGRWQSFTFLDPTDNLLNFSEDVSQPCWESDPLLAMNAASIDPFGGAGAWRMTNTAQSTQAMRQWVPVPGWYQYCFTVYLRADKTSPVELYSEDGSEELITSAMADTSWKRIQHSFRMTSTAERLACGIRLAAGQSVFAFGCQLEAQLGSGGYKKTRDQAGIYDGARFDQDDLQAAATGANQYACTVQIVSNTTG